MRLPTQELATKYGIHVSLTMLVSLPAKTCVISLLFNEQAEVDLLFSSVFDQLYF